MAKWENFLHLFFKLGLTNCSCAHKMQISLYRIKSLISVENMRKIGKILYGGCLE
jgi:hypothetical protein